MEQFLGLFDLLRVWVQHWGYLAVFAGILVENAGVPVPGETIIILASLMAGQGLLQVQWVFAAVVLGATIGGNIGYGIGMVGGRPLIERLARRFHVGAADLDAMEARFNRHADLAVFVGRFVMVLRIFAGPVAGALRMSWPRFFLVNFAGALLWAALVVGLSYLFGENVAKLLNNVGLTLFVVVFVGAGVLGFKWWRAKRLLKG